MYDFVTHTWNVIKGKCSHACVYCYMRRFPQKDLHFDEKELKTDLGKDNFIFVGSSTDMFAKDVPKEWIERVIEHCKKFDNTYLFQSKNPRRFLDFEFPQKVILGTTIESDQDWGVSDAPPIYDRVNAMIEANKFSYDTMITIEPIIDFIPEGLIDKIKRINPNWVNIGADSKGSNLPEPSAKKLRKLIEELSDFTIIKKKTNLKRLLVT